MTHLIQGVKWTKCPECGDEFSGRGTEAAVKLFSHRLRIHNIFTEWAAAVRSMTDTMQDVSTLPEAIKNAELAFP